MTGNKVRQGYLNGIALNLAQHGVTESMIVRVLCSRRGVTTAQAERAARRAMDLVQRRRNEEKGR